jgi:hypothetical protein
MLPWSFSEEAAADYAIGRTGSNQWNLVLLSVKDVRTMIVRPV